MTQPHGRNRRSSATLEEVAHVAGVSRATVSRVVNGSPGSAPTSAPTSRRPSIALGYVPNRAARSLVTRRSDSIAVVITEPTGRLFSDPFFPRLLRGISAELSARDLQLVLLMPESAADERADRRLPDRRPRRRRAAGQPPRRRSPARSPGRGRDPDRRWSAGRRRAIDGELRRRRQPAGRPDRGRAPDRGGRRVIATIAGPPDMAAGDRSPAPAIATRSPTAASALDASLEAVGDFTQESGAAAMKRLLAARPDIDAVFAASDLMAAGALTVLAAAGRRVPEDVAVVGFDDSPVATTTTPQLTSVRQPIEEMGREMARLLVEAVEASDPVPRRVILATELVRRASSAGRPAP